MWLPSNQHSGKKKSLLLSRKTFSVNLNYRLNGKRSSIVCPWLHATKKHSSITKLKMTSRCSLQQHIYYNCNDSEKITWHLHKDGTLIHESFHNFETGTFIYCAKSENSKTPVMVNPAISSKIKKYIYLSIQKSQV